MKVVELISQHGEKTFEVEIIINHKQKGKKMWYFVKWRDLKENENSLIPADNFNSYKEVQDYHKNIEKVNYISLSSDSEKESEKPVKRLKISTISIPPISFIYAFFLFSLLFITDAQIVLKGKFNYCVESNAELLDMTEACIRLDDVVKPSNSNRKETINLSILHKIKNLIDGYGFQ